MTQTLISQPDLHDFLAFPNSVIYGFDFSHQGLLGIWEGNIPTLSISHQNQSDSPLNPTNNPYHDRRSSRHADEIHPSGGGNLLSALSVLVARQVGAGDVRTWKPGVATTKIVQRQIALLLCGWSLKEEEILETIRKWVFSSTY